MDDTDDARNCLHGRHAELRARDEHASARPADNKALLCASGVHADLQLHELRRIRLSGWRARRVVFPSWLRICTTQRNTITRIAAMANI